jgi:TPP-dependent pyruvate/acetoin dehydrogenase alpha subunit
MFGHYIGDQQRYRPDAEAAATRDPLPGFQEAVISAGILDEAAVESLEAECARQIDEAVEKVRAAAMLAPELALADTYA